MDGLYHVRVWRVNTNVIGKGNTFVFMKTLAERVTWSRTQKGLTQGQLAKMSGVSQGTIGNIEAGIRLTARKLPQIAAALGVDPLWLAEGDSIAAKRVKRDSQANLPAGVHYDIITTEERTLLTLYRSATDRGQQVIMSSAERAEKELAAGASPSNKV